MTQVTFDPALGGDGSTVSDDSNASTGLGNGGHRSRFVAALVQMVAMIGFSKAQATAAAQSAVNAAAAAAAGAPLWVSGKTYAVGDVAASAVNYLPYRRKTAGAGTTDPSLDSTNWADFLAAKANLGGGNSFSGNQTISGNITSSGGLIGYGAGAGGSGVATINMGQLSLVVNKPSGVLRISDQYAFTSRSNFPVYNSFVSDKDVVLVNVVNALLDDYSGSPPSNVTVNISVKATPDNGFFNLTWKSDVSSMTSVQFQFVIIQGSIT